MNQYRIIVTTEDRQEFEFYFASENKNIAMVQFINSTDIHNIILIKIEER